MNNCIEKDDLQEVQLVHVGGGGRGLDGRYMSEVTLLVPNPLAAQILSEGVAQVFDRHTYDQRRTDGE